MNVLILTQWYPPEPAILIQELAQSLQKQGHRITILTGFPNYPYGKLYDGYKIKLYQHELLNDVNIYRVPLYPNHSSSSILRIINYLSFAISATFLTPWLVNRPDAIFVYHPPLTVAIPAFFLSKYWRIKFMYQIHDMWPETLSATGMLNSPKILNLIAKFALWVYNKADRVLVSTKGLRDNLITKGVQNNKIKVISNWVDPNLYFPIEPDLSQAEELGLNGNFNVMYAGNIGEAQALEIVIEAAKILRNETTMQFVLVGDGTALNNLKKLAESYKLNNVLFLGRFQSEDMSQIYSFADLLLVHLKDDPLFRINIPHKILSYMGVGKPILSNVEGNVADLLHETRSGFTCSPGDPQKLAEVIKTISTLSKAELNEMGQNGLNAAKNLFSRDVLTKEIGLALKEMV